MPLSKGVSHIMANAASGLFEQDVQGKLNTLASDPGEVTLGVPTDGNRVIQLLNLTTRPQHFMGLVVEVGGDFIHVRSDDDAPFGILDHSAEGDPQPVIKQPVAKITVGRGSDGKWALQQAPERPVEVIDSESFWQFLRVVAHFAQKKRMYANASGPANPTVG